MRTRPSTRQELPDSLTSETRPRWAPSAVGFSLCAVTVRLMSSLRQRPTGFRLGAAEIVIGPSSPAAAAEAEAHAERLPAGRPGGADRAAADEGAAAGAALVGTALSGSSVPNSRSGAGLRASRPAARTATAEAARTGAVRRHRREPTPVRVGPESCTARAARRSSGRSARSPVAGASWVSAASSMSSSSAAVGRRAGSFSRVIATRSRSGAGNPSSRGRWVRMAAAVAAGESAANGVRPVPAYVTTTPHANTSAAGPTLRAASASNRSGAMYATVPTI
ncbi:hypothetical protein Asp14428_80410 [Actinoplanes sp. NBRC 14428]|nr:hypothetical protein Asp14428_80410 [Actinoplanes sp. NBRC 14428]